MHLSFCQDLYDRPFNLSRSLSHTSLQVLVWIPVFWMDICRAVKPKRETVQANDLCMIGIDDGTYRHVWWCQPKLDTNNHNNAPGSIVSASRWDYIQRSYQGMHQYCKKIDLWCRRWVRASQSGFCKNLPETHFTEYFFHTTSPVAGFAPSTAIARLFFTDVYDLPFLYSLDSRTFFFPKMLVNIWFGIVAGCYTGRDLRFFFL